MQELCADHVGKTVVVRARLHNSRKQSKNLGFVVMRQSYGTVQIVIAKSDIVSPHMIDFVSKIPKESIVEVKATVTQPEKGVAGCSQ